MQRPPLYTLHSSPPPSPIVSATSLHYSIPPVTPLSAAEHHVHQRRLVIPSVRPTPVSAPKPPKVKTGKFSRQTRSGSVSVDLAPNCEPKDWVSGLGKMRIVDDRVELHGYQIYAVEKWVVERGRLITVVCVYTGDQRHKITVTILAPFSSLSDTQAQAEFDNVLHLLRRDGARPRETKHGILLVTSLANFRSDYNLIPIPDGNFLTVREKLYVNINLLRMGCSGRSALTLAEPSEPTKDRFINMYCFSESSLSHIPFNHAVLELVKLVQCALVLFGMFDPSPEERNGLLCDVTTEGIRRWTDSVGERLLSLEPMERVADPSVVSALLSLVVTMRNKLHALGFTQVPKDPFGDPQAFMQVVSTFQTQRLPSNFATLSPGCLSLIIVECINDAYERSKGRGTDSRVSRMILSKIDDITTDLNLRGSVDAAFTGHIYTTSDLAGFVAMIVGAGHKDVVDSLKGLWTGKSVKRKKTKKDGIDEEERDRTDGKSTDDEDSMQSLFPSWGRHMKIEGLKSFDFGMGRSKKPSIDLTTKTRTFKSLSADEAFVPMTAPIPHFVISGDSGPEGSPYSGDPPSLKLSPVPSSRSSNINVTSSKFNFSGGRLPPMPVRFHSGLSTASDPVGSPRAERHALLRRTSVFERVEQVEDEDEETEDEAEHRVDGGVSLGAMRRRHSMEDLSVIRQGKPIPIERLSIDVGLCGQYLIMHRREKHLQNIMSLIQLLNFSLSFNASQLEDDMAANEPALDSATRLRHEVWSALNAAETSLKDWDSVRGMLEYQAEEMDIRYLSRCVRQQRARILAARQMAFGAPPGTRPRSAFPSRYFRVQNTLDPEEQRLVDSLGRTESEVEEEAAIPDEEIGQQPSFEELQAWGFASAKDEKKSRRSRWWWWWWPSKSGGGSDDETNASQSVVHEER